MDNSAKFVDGIPIIREVKEITKKTPLHIMLGLSSERMDEISKICRIAMINSENKGQVKIDDALFEVAKSCHTLNEYTMAVYALGYKIGTKQNPLGSLGGMIIGQMGMGGFGKMGEDGREGEDPSIEELIRRSKRINGGKKEDNGTEEDL